ARSQSGCLSSRSGAAAGACRTDERGPMAITGAHALLYTSEPEQLRAVLRAKGIEFRGEPENQGFGTVITMVLPGGVDMMLYQPRHANRDLTEGRAGQRSVQPASLSSL